MATWGKSPSSEPSCTGKAELKRLPLATLQTCSKKGYCSRSAEPALRLAPPHTRCFWLEQNTRQNSHARAPQAQKNNQQGQVQDRVWGRPWRRGGQGTTTSGQLLHVLRAAHLVRQVLAVLQIEDLSRVELQLAKDRRCVLFIFDLLTSRADGSPQEPGIGNGLVWTGAVWCRVGLRVGCARWVFPLFLFPRTPRIY